MVINLKSILSIILKSDRAQGTQVQDDSMTSLASSVI
ncbi:unnamed protein product [Brassica oleracea var. botrytis]|uniref:(rape) hypothetical protein n=1 Tax=Brassica napus TaxID=3708 RepID=A0A816V1S2_BRANA|nr:unnamed protein product [Brassica napus]